MPKRTAPATPSPSSVNPTKLVKVDNVWSTIPDNDEKVKEFKPVEGGPKTKIVKTMVLNLKPRVCVDIALRGSKPELHFTDDTNTFSMSGDDFVTMTGSHFGERGPEIVRMEALEESDGGYRLSKYKRVSSGVMDLDSTDVFDFFDLNKYAARRLKAKESAVSEHIVTLMQNEKVTLIMFKCVVDVYKCEYARLNSLRPITEHFHELSRVVELYVPAVVIVKTFLDKLYEERLTSKFNHYSLLTAVLIQKDLIFTMIHDS